MAKNYAEILREMLNDVKARVAEAEGRRADCMKLINEVNNQRTASNQELVGIKKSFLFSNWWKAKRKDGITAEEARQEAERYGNYANVVDKIAEEEKRLQEAKMSWSKADDDAEKRSVVQGKVEELMDVLGLIE